MAEASVHTQNEAPKALDVPTTNVHDLVKPNTEGYHEDADHRPDPLYQYGTVDTSDTAGAAHQSVAEVSPAFDEARVRNLVTAARALDPDDDGVGEELVTLPQGSVTVTGSVRTGEEARREIEGKLKRAADEPILLGGPSEQQRRAAEEDDSADERKELKDDAGPNPTATTSESTQTQAAAASRTQQRANQTGQKSTRS